MDATAAISGLVGAVIGSFTSVVTLYVQNVFQNRREHQRLLYETAYKDYELRMVHAPEYRGAFPTILDYHQRMFEMIEKGSLTPGAVKEIMRKQGEMQAAVQSAVEQPEQAAKPHRGTHT